MFEKTALFITPQEIKNNNQILPNYINDIIFKNILIKNGWIILDYKSLNYNLYKKKGIGFIYKTGDISYSKNIYTIPVFIKNLFEVKSHRKITNKYDLYLYLKNISSVQNNIIHCFNLDNLTSLPSNDVYIARPIGGYEGKGIKNLTNQEDFDVYKIEYENIKQKISDNNLTITEKKIWDKGVILSKYITNPLLFNNKKFHIRTYLMISKIKNYNKHNFIWRWSFFHQGKILTAQDDYINGDWNNKLIHDTHIKSTQDDYYFPQDLHLNKTIENNIIKQMENICFEIFNIIKISNIKTFNEVVNSFEVLGLDFMLLDDFTVKILEVNNKLGYGVINQGSDKVNKYTYDFFNWIYLNGVKPLEKFLL